MKTNTLALAFELSDQDLLSRLERLAATERETSAELVAHLAVLEMRPSAYAALGHGSLFSYCTRVLRLSEDAACTRIAVARACRRFPAIIDALSAGDVSLTAVRMLSPHLTSDNYEAVLATARGRTRAEIEELVAELAPQPDVPSSVRKLPSPTPVPPAPDTRLFAAESMSSPDGAPVASLPIAAAPPSAAPQPRPVVRPTSPHRYRVQFTIGQETQEKLRRLQALLRPEIPDGDPAEIFDRALSLLLEKVEKAKWGRAASRAVPPPSIRSGTDKTIEPSAGSSRHRPRSVDRAAWQRDEGRCGFVGKNGIRCTERAFLEFHHIKPYAHGGPATVENISLRCRRHNQYEAQLVFGPRPGPNSV